jgi:hypothetical protein
MEKPVQSLYCGKYKGFAAAGSIIKMDKTNCEEDIVLECLFFFNLKRSIFLKSQFSS